MDEEGNQFVAYFLPNEDTLRKRKRDVEEELDFMPEELYEHTHTHKHAVSAKSLHLTVQVFQRRISSEKLEGTLHASVMFQQLC